jgi:hypothetical protein
LRMPVGGPFAIRPSRKNPAKLNEGKLTITYWGFEEVAPRQASMSAHRAPVRVRAAQRVGAGRLSNRSLDSVRCHPDCRASVQPRRSRA